MLCQSEVLWALDGPSLIPWVPRALSWGVNRPAR